MMPPNPIELELCTRLLETCPRQQADKNRARVFASFVYDSGIRIRPEGMEYETFKESVTNAYFASLPMSSTTNGRGFADRLSALARQTREERCNRNPFTDSDGGAGYD